MTDALPSLAALERYVAAKQDIEAANEAVRILQTIDATQGQIAAIDWGVPMGQMDDADLYERFATRFASAFGDWISRADVQIGPEVIEQLFIHHRWIDAMFAVSGFQSSDHLIIRFATPEGQWALGGARLIQFLIAHSLSSTLDINLDESFAANPGAAVIGALGYLSTRVVVTERANAFRDALLEWLPAKLPEVGVGRMRLSCVAEIYMHCSYATTPRKHEIKAALNAQVRAAMLAEGATDMIEAPPPRAKPRIAVVCEHFREGHSVWRTHSRAVQALRERFEVIGVFINELVDDAGKACFDYQICFGPGELFASAAEVSRAILAFSPDVVLHLGVGMTNHTIALSTLRLAPVQCVSFGHTATTMNPAIDWFVLPSDFVASESAFSERVLALDPKAMPYAKPAPSEPPAPPRGPSTPEGPLRIAIPASVMKLNAPFLAALAQIRDRAMRPVQFHFFPLAAVGLAHRQIVREISRVLPGSVVYPQLERMDYMTRLGECAFFLSPFPYGNMNSIIDAMTMGLPGVCMDGPEAHSHADGAYFRRLGLPEMLVTEDVEHYVIAAANLVNFREWLETCQGIVQQLVDLDDFYEGDARPFADALAALVGVKPKKAKGLKLKRARLR